VQEADAANGKVVVSAYFASHGARHQARPLLDSYNIVVIPRRGGRAGARRLPAVEVR